MAPVSEPASARFLARKGAGWVRWGTGFMAALAAAALAITVIVAQRALGGASTVVVRGESEALLAAIDSEQTTGLDDATSAELEEILAKHHDAGLRYIAVVERDGSRSTEAGVATMHAPLGKPGDLIIDGTRARFVENAPPRHGGAPHHGPGRDGRHDRERTESVPDPFAVPPHEGFPPGSPPPSPVPAPDDGPDFAHGPGERPPPFDGPDFDGPHPPGHGGPPLVVFELEPPVIASLRADVRRTLVVAAIAGLVLVGFAVGWSRSLLHLSKLEQQAERERRLVALGRMSSVMAHELKNPLASLKGHAQLLAEQLDHDPKAKAKAERVVGEAERLEALTKSLLDFVRDGPLDLRPIRPTDLLQQALADLPLDRVEISLDRAPEKLRVDAGRASRALHNLAHNAIQASSDGERVSVKVTSKGSDAIIEIRDHGGGLAPGSERTIFEPFVTTRVRGTGLGLPIARRIAEQHGGTLTGETHPEGGAVFRLTLPGAAESG